ncbi:MAG: AsmA family protein, partial [Saprospiraceae bacterium]|nr:AsmA family protein [Saprospiraceae bacterium]
MNVTPEPYRKKRKWVRVLTGVLLILVLVPVFLTVAIQIPMVQNWAKDKVTHYASERLGVDVQLQKVDLDIFQHIYLNKLSVASPDPDQDTLLTLGTFRIDLAAGLFSLLRQNLQIDELQIQNLRTTLITDSTGRNTINKLVDHWNNAQQSQEGTPGGKPKPFDLSINSIRCKECLVILQNKYNFSEQAFHFPGLTLQAK